MKELKDYLHLYLGCQVIYQEVDEEEELCTLFDISIDGNIKLEIKSGEYHKYYYVESDTVKLILRPLSDMAEDEMKELFFIGNRLIKEFNPNAVIKFYPNEVKRNVKRGTGVAYSVLKSENGEHFISGTLSLTKLDAVQFYFLLSKHFDLFGLIESGLAIDKTTIKCD